MGDLGGGEGWVVEKRKVIMNEYFPRKEKNERETYEN